MKELQKKIKTILEEIENKYKNEDDALFAKTKVLELYDVFADELENLETGANGEYQFSDAMLKLMQKQDFYACKFDGKYFDIGNQLGYLKANVDFALDREDVKDDFKKFLVKRLENGMHPLE